MMPIIHFGELESCDESNDSKSETITPDDYEITEKFEMVRNTCVCI